MDNGCPKCNRLTINGIDIVLCLDCQLEQAEATALQAMNEVERIKQKIKEKENVNEASHR